MLDTIDIQIINNLVKNSRNTLTELAKEIDLSNVAIQSRITKLEQKGFILNYTSQINYKLLGFGTIAFIGIFLDKAENYKAVIAELDKVEQITEAHFTTGNYSIFAKVYAKDNDHLMVILNTKIQNIKGISRTETFISLEEGILKPLFV
jgi:Lrp/AsnC family transcriptional regulator for asnA, asnC and gidA